MSEVSCLGAGVNYPGFISQKDLLRRERIYIHAITINLSGPGCIQSFLENLNYIEKLRREGKVENCPLALQQQKCVFVQHCQSSHVSVTLSLHPKVICLSG